MEGHDPDRSPYKVDLLEVIRKFALSKERADILLGLMSYRAAWHNLGISSGFQWLDGSFFENVEDLEARSPRDVDVVTFFDLPPGQTQRSLFPSVRPLLDVKATKTTYSVDAYGFPMGGAYDERAMKNTAYWYSMWSHRRNGMWKGFVQVSLDPANDSMCTSEIHRIIAGGFS